MSKDYEVLNELVPKTQKLHRAIFDKGYEQGQRGIIDTIRAEVTALKSHHINDSYDNGFQGCRIEVLDIIDKYNTESEEA